MKPFTIQAWHDPKEIDIILQHSGFKVYDIIQPEHLNDAIGRIYRTGLNVMLFHTKQDQDVIWLDTYKFGQR